MDAQKAAERKAKQQQPKPPPKPKPPVGPDNELARQLKGERTKNINLRRIGNAPETGP